MLEKDKFTVINIREFLSGKTKGLGENELQSLLSEFSCTKNPDVEYFLKKNAIEFTKKNQSVTYLVIETETAEVVGYFTIAIKPISLNADMWSKSVLRKISRVGKLNMKDNTYRLSAFLIGQLGKNDAKPNITGKELLELAVDQIRVIQYIAGGMVIFLEAGNQEKILSFYKENGFQIFATRTEEQDLIQLLKLL